jgi:hypothetical protein
MLNISFFMRAIHILFAKMLVTLEGELFVDLGTKLKERGSLYLITLNT